MSQIILLKGRRRLAEEDSSNIRFCIFLRNIVFVTTGSRTDEAKDCDVAAIPIVQLLKTLKTANYKTLT